MDPVKAKLKIAKLLRLGENTGATTNEAETALRQADALMRKYGITRAQIVEGGGEVTYNWESGFYEFGRDGKPVKKNPIWYQWLIVGIANFTDTIASNAYDYERGAGVKFKGEAEDVVLALWFADYLKDAIRLATRAADAGSPQGREEFRKAMSLRLCARMREMRQQRTQETTGTALVVVSDKLAKRDEQFGQAKYKTGKAVTLHMGDVVQKAVAAANKVQFNKPLSGAVQERITG